MPFDLKAWLDEVGIDPTQPLDAQLKDQARLNKLQSSVMRTSDYKKSKDEYDRLEAKIAEKDKALDADYAKLGESRAAIDGEYQRMKKERDTLAAKANGAIAKLKTIAEQNGISADDLDLPVIDARGDGGGDDDDTKKKTPAFNTDDFVSRKDFQSVAGTLLLSPAELMDLDDMHKALFNGKNLANKTQFQKDYLTAVHEAARAGKKEPSLTTFFEAKFNVAERKAELQEKEIDDRVARRVEEQLVKERTARAENKGVDPNQPDGSPILRHRDKLGKREESTGANRENRGVVAAIASYDDVKSRIDRGAPNN